mmetsp:Transcript_7726/g.8819  ORF Transcript_7726/g.8819 Transcript_7726/m.8819 type:complete len:302 (-) Transcript_7726:60-965(-)|eukprot:CAMPEP_0194149172 /NCGR_PEP_ID=MMETSP0152-20130528/36601_1 /TAXON_ID=1049557 /ORGANISM="Thalassiothrix antarctica, Strain L6-D1" /LENGTH=301 /DNA_ID=CAMNT_0038851175 /DNA_START=109 /DNA_END=1014 /DNA_ORIENTATION=+
MEPRINEKLNQILHEKYLHTGRHTIHDRKMNLFDPTYCSERKNETTEYSHSKGGGYVPQSFPQILRIILSDRRNNNFITWLPHGYFFRILDWEKLVEQVLPQYFGNNCALLFSRNLIRWNFRQVPNGPDKGAWYNWSFVRDDYPSLNNDIKQEQKIKFTNIAPDKSPLNQKQQKNQHSKKPLKKRPVDASLFLTDNTTKMIEDACQVQMLSQLQQQKNLVSCGVPSYNTFGDGRSLALTNTQSIIQAAMKALIQSHASSLDNNNSSFISQPNLTSTHPLKNQLVEVQERILSCQKSRGSFF